MKITEIESKSQTVRISNESYVPLGEFLRVINDVEPCGCIIVPYLIKKGKREELYYYELILSETESFRDYIRRTTGRKYNEVNSDIVFLRRKCFIELTDKSPSEIRREISEYIDFVLTDKNITRENLYFAFY